jgi:5'-3' exoribonuclease 1
MAKASEVLGPDTEARVREVKSWLKFKGVRDFEPVSLFCDQLAKACPPALFLRGTHRND